MIARGRFHRKSAASGRNGDKSTGNPIRTDRARGPALAGPRRVRRRALQPERRSQFVEQFALERNEPRAWLLRDREVEHRIGDVGANIRQRLDDREPAERHVRLRITALVHDHEPPAAMALRGLLHRTRHEPVAVGMQLHACERIDRACVEAARDDDQLGPETLQRRQHDSLERVAIRIVAAAREQRHVQVRADACAFAAVVGAAVAGREAAILVQRNRQRVRIVVVDRLRAVAVVHVPVDHRDALDAVFRTGGLDRDRDVRQQAEAHRAIAQAMMAGRPRQREGVRRTFAEDRIDGRDRESGRQRGDLVAALAERREIAEVAAVRVAECAERVEIVRGMNAQQVGGRGRLGAAQVELCGQARGLHERQEAALRIGRFRVARARRRLDPAADREEQRVRAAGVPESAFVGEEGSAIHGCA